MERAAAGVAIVAFAVLAASVFYLVGGPLLDNDMWWHLAHGRAYLESGPYLAEDPCLGTATRGPIPHQWAFAVAARGVEMWSGIQGLRVAHALAALGIGALALGACRRQAGSLAPALLGTSVFLVLAWYRMVQLRPELLTIAGALLLQRWLFAPALPSRRQVAQSVGLVWLWANVHAAFMVGPLLIAAALAGVGARYGVERFWLRGDATPALRKARRLGGALLVGGIASLANPRGWQQHLAYFESTKAGAIQFVADEWARFDPFAHTNLAPAVSALAWVVADLLIALFFLIALLQAVRFLRAPSAERLDALDPLRLALGVAGLVAAFSAIRFLWLGIFPVLYLLHAARHSRVPASRQAPLAAAAVAGLAIAFPMLGGFADVAVHLPGDLRSWIREAHTRQRFFERGVRFLAETGVSGQLFHGYALGGYLCHQLAPRMRTFVDGSMNYPDDVSRDYRSLIVAQGAEPGEALGAALERRGVDLFFGFGVPLGGETAYTTAALEGHPRWIRVSRSWRHGIYLRANAQNEANLARIAAWYASQGIAFDPERGFDPGAALRDHRAWSEAWGLLPKGWLAILDAAEAGGPTRSDDLETAGLAYALVGAYPEQVASDRRVARLRPRAKAPRRRLVYGLLRLDRPLQALAIARELLALDPQDERSQAFSRAVARVSRATTPDARIAAINRLPLLSSRQPLQQ